MLCHATCGSPCDLRRRPERELGTGSILLVNHTSQLDVFAMGSFIPASAQLPRLVFVGAHCWLVPPHTPSLKGYTVPNQLDSATALEHTVCLFRHTPRR